MQLAIVFHTIKEIQKLIKKFMAREANPKRKAMDNNYEPVEK